MSDLEAVALAISGNPLGFQALYESHNKAVYHQCLLILRDHEDAEDVTQNVFLRLHRKIGQFQGRCAFTTWLYKMAHNEILTYKRKQKSRPPTGAGDCPDRAAPATQHAELEIEDLLSKLPEIERHYMKAKMQGYSVKKLGGSMGIRSLRQAKDRLAEVMA
jgi:RNA polymerase sigma factor (sigma-70 family)